MKETPALQCAPRLAAAIGALLLAAAARAQCTPGMPAPADECANAPLISTTGTYCGNTAAYTPDNPNWLHQSPVFGGYTIENNAFYRFVAAGPSIEFKFCSFNCNNGFMGGSQFLIFSGNCGGPAAKVFLIPQLYVGVGTCSVQTGAGFSRTLVPPYQGSGINASKAKEVGGCIRIIINGFTVGQTYRIMIDGFEGSVCDFSLEFYNGIELPIELVSFSGRATAEGNVLEWATASERGNAYFEVESSADAMAFRTIGMLPGAGDSRSLRAYTAVDPAPDDPLTYYRLKQVDRDGAYTRSEVIAVRSALRADQQPFPNPAQDEVTVPLDPLASGLHRATFFGAAGQAFEQEVEAEAGPGRLRIGIPPGLANGLYQLTVTDATDRPVHTGRVLVVR